MERHRFVGDHTEDLDSGRVLAPGEFVELDAEELKLPHNARLVEEGLLVDAPLPEKTKPTGKGGNS